jgi:hypothetical protein
LDSAPAGSNDSAVLQFQGDQSRLDSLLTEQATNLLERFGDRFYVLGVYMDAVDGEPGEISTRHWAALDAPADEWRDSLMIAFADYRPKMRSAAYLLDRWPGIRAESGDSTYAILHFETAGGRCYEARRRYDLSSGRPVWAAPDPLPCKPTIWAHSTR